MVRVAIQRLVLFVGEEHAEQFGVFSAARILVLVTLTAGASPMAGALRAGW